MGLTTAKSLNRILLLPIIAGIVLAFMHTEPPELGIIIIVQLVMLGFVIAALSATSLRRQKTLGAIPYVLVIIESIVVIVIAFATETPEFAQGMAAALILSIVGLVRLLRAEE